MALSPEIQNIIRTVMREHGVPPEAEPFIFAIAIGESSGNPQARRHTDNADLAARGYSVQPEDSVGLFQLNRMGGRGTGYSVQQLMDPWFNTRVNMPAMKNAWERMGGAAAAQANPAGFLAEFYPTAQGSIPISTDYAGQLLSRAGSPAGQGGAPHPPATGQAGMTGGGDVALQNFVEQYQPLWARFQELDLKVAPYELVEYQRAWDDQHGLGYWVPTGGVETDRMSPNFGQPIMQVEWVLTPDEFAEFETLHSQIEALEMQYDQQFGGESLADAIRHATFMWESDPQNIDAMNAAEEFARQMEIRAQASRTAGDRHRAQMDQLDAAMDSQDRVRAGLTPHVPAEQRLSGVGSLVATPDRLVSFEDMFSDEVGRLQDELPEVPARPYFDDRDVGVHTGGPSLAEMRIGGFSGSVGGGGGGGPTTTPQGVPRPPGPAVEAVGGVMQQEPGHTPGAGIGTLPQDPSFLSRLPGRMGQMIAGTSPVLGGPMAAPFVLAEQLGVPISGTAGRAVRGIGGLLGGGEVGETPYGPRHSPDRAGQPGTYDWIRERGAFGRRR